LGRVGFLTQRQVEVLKYWSRGLSTRQIARILGTSHQDVASSLKRALQNIERAKTTLLAYKVISSALRVVIKEGTRLIDVPVIVVSEADRVGVRVRGDFTLIFKLIRYKARACVSGRVVSKPVLVLVDRDGNIDIYPYDEVADLLEQLGVEVGVEA